MNKETLKKELQSKSVDELKTHARNVELKGFSGLKKEELIDKLMENDDFIAQNRRGWISNLIGKNHHHFYGGTALVLEIAAVVIALVSLFVFWPRSTPAATDTQDATTNAAKTQIDESDIAVGVEYTEKNPKIVGIYPSDTFGPYRKAGLHAIIDNYPEIKLIDLDMVSTAQMKRNEISEISERLKSLITDDNIVAIVGPPITECTKAILDVVAETNSNIPIILESAIGKSHLGWDEYRQKMKIYRISSGIDRRAVEVSRLLKEFSDADKTVKIFVEQDTGNIESSYGEFMLESVRYMYADWEQSLSKGNIDITYYPSTDLESAIPLLRANADSADLVVVFGLGDHYKAFAESLYLKMSESPGDFSQPPMLGIMIGYALKPAAVSAELESEKLFEITDFDFDLSGPVPECYTQFMTHFGKPNPANRDQAYSYDAGHCIVTSLERVFGLHEEVPRGKYLFMNVTVLDQLTSDFDSNVYSGVTGEIKFGNDGQNVGNRLIYARINSESKSWATSNYRDIHFE